MPERFAVNPTSLGEVLACAGLAWLAERDDPGVQSGFVEQNGQWFFEVPFCVEQLAELASKDPVPCGDHLMVASLRLDWWQRAWGLNPDFKFWAGQQSARSVMTNLMRASREGDSAQWNSYLAPTTGRLGVDPQGNWDSLSLGWSINEHSHVQSLCRPYVEWLAFLALQAFPVQGSRSEGFRYHLWRPAPLAVAILAFAGAGRHAAAGFIADTGKSGSNTILRSAEPIQE